MHDTRGISLPRDWLAARDAAIDAAVAYLATSDAVPVAATTAAPGSAMKIAVLQARAAVAAPLWHPNDAQDEERMTTGLRQTRRRCRRNGREVLHGDR